MKLVAVFALIGSFIAMPVSGQSGSNAQTLHVYSRIVSLDVVVTDKNGKIVPDLTKDDFRILEDKQPQAIRNFESIQDHKIQGPTGQVIVRSSADLKNIGTAPVTVLVLDEMVTQFSDMAYSRQCVEHYLRRQPEILTQPTTILVVRSDKFLVLHDYTQDRKSLLEAIHKYEPVNPRISGLAAGDGKRIMMTLGALEQIAKAQMGTPGRKNIVWIGKGFPAIDPTGGNDSSVSEPILASFEAALHMTTDLMLRVHIALFVIDPAGVVGGGMIPASTQTGDESDPNTPSGNAGTPTDTGTAAAPDQGEFSFVGLAPLTGGKFFYNRNDIDEQIATSIEEGTSYYTLTYVPSNNSDAATTYRHIRVLLKRPGLYVQTRLGYYPPDALNPVKLNPTGQQVAETGQKIELADLANAAANRMSYNAIDIKAPQKAEHGSYRLYVKASDLSWKPQDDGRFAADVALFVVSFSVQGKVTGRSYVEIRKTTAQPPPPGNNAQVVYDLPFDAPPNSTRLRFVIRDGSSAKIGTTDLKTP
jgi:VWFA-related protein